MPYSCLEFDDYHENTNLKIPAALPANQRVALDGYCVPRCEFRAELYTRKRKREHGGEQVGSKSLSDFPALLA